MKRLYRILLRIYPVGFREEYGSELERQFTEEYREAGGWRERTRLSWRALLDVAATAPGEALRELRQDLRYAARVYRRRPAATVLALGALALAIGATTGIFSVLNALLIRSLPFRDADRLVFHVSATGSDAYLEGAATYAAQPMNLGVGGESYRATVCESTDNFFHLLGASPQLGRGFSAGEDAEGRSAVAVIGYGLWQQAFGGDARAIGATIRLNGSPVTVIGVAAPTFDFPDKSSVWTPTAKFHLPSINWMPQTIGRLKHGVSFSQASAIYRAEAERENARGPKRAEQAASLAQLQDRLAGPVRPASLVLMGLMAFVLLIACANLAHLLLSRTTERCQELAIRAALGASRARLTRQLITEAIVLTSTAAITGLAVAQWTARLAAVAQPEQLAARPYSVLDWRVLAFTLGVAAITGLVFGVLPASLIGRMQPGRDAIRIQAGTRGSSANRVRMGLIALQAALAVTLASGTFSMGRSFLKMMGIDLGYRTSRVVTMSVSLPLTHDRTAPLVRKALAELRAVPGVQSAGAASYLPLVPSSIQEGTFFRMNEGEPKRSSRVMLVSPDFFRTMGTALLEGREFTERDRRGSEPVVIVTEDLARSYGGPRLVGNKIYLEPARVWATVVGVVRAQRFQGPESGPWEAIYRPMDQYEQWFATFVARVRGNPETYLALCRDAVQKADRSVPVFDVKTLDQRLADATARPRFYTTAILFLTGFALLLAAIGAYGAASHVVSQRRHEIGVRIAVGGPPRRVRGLILREGIAPVCTGIAAGLGGAWELSGLLKHLMASAERVRIGTCASAALAIAAATVGAIWVGTRRVARTDPAAALRVE